MFVLAVEIHKTFADVLQLRKRRGAAVDPRPAPALRIERAAEQDLAVRRAEIVRGEPCGDARGILGVEDGGELRPFRARPELAKLEPIAEEQSQAVEQDRLAGAGFPGEDRKAAVELEVERLDDDEVADRQKAKHRGPRAPSPCSHWWTWCEQAYLPCSRSGVSLQCSFSRSIAKWSWFSGCRKRAV